jgi:hypothetical protein
MKCKNPTCNQSKLWIERIDSGIKQEVTYHNGFITKEVTTYDKKVGVAICGVCGTEHDEYNL